MKKKFLLDIILFITLVLSMFYNFTGNIIHEVIGLIIFISLILHLTLNYSFIKTILKRKKITINIIINILLFMSLLIVIITGILISHSLFSNFNNTSLLLINIHKISSFIIIALFFIHLLLHLNILTVYITKTFKIENKANIKYGLIITSFIFIILIIKSNYPKQTLKKDSKENTLNSPSSSDNTSTTEEDSSDNPPTLDEYLSKLHCSGCHNNCILTSTKCGRGNYYYEQAKEKYYEEYGNEISYNGNNNSYETTDGIYEIDI